MSEEAGEVHPVTLSVTVKLYLPGDRFVTVVLEPEPDKDTGLIIQSPAGRPFINTLPVGVVQSGCIICPGTGAAGVALTVSV